MKQTFKNNIVITITTVGVILLLIGGFIYNAFYGNPFSKKKAVENITGYIEDTYETVDYTLLGVTFDAKTGHYGSEVFFTYSEDTQFFVSYDVPNSKIYDNYKDVVTSGLNTALRLNNQYDIVITAALQKQYSNQECYYYGQLGKNQNYQNHVQLDMPFDLENLPMDSTVCLILEQENIQWETLAQALLQLHDCLKQENLIPTYYDIGLTQSTQRYISVEDFSSALLEEEMDVAQLAEILQNHAKENHLVSQ